jgi:hypothetical protein
MDGVFSEQVFTDFPTVLGNKFEPCAKRWRHHRRQRSLDYPRIRASK